MMDEAEMYFDKDDDTLVKVNIVDDDDPTQTTCAAIPQEYYDRILSGQSTLRKEFDKDGNVQFVLVDIEPVESNESLQTSNQVINNTPNVHSMNQNEEIKRNTDEPHIIDQLVNKDEELKGEEYVITEYPSNGDYFVVVIEDSNGEHIFEKDGQIGDTLMLDLCGNTISYLISGPNDDGSIRQTTVVIDQSDADKSADLTETNLDDQAMNHENTRNIEDGEEEYVMTEESVLINDQVKQMVRLSDREGRVLDTKYGASGDAVKLQLVDNAFEYTIQGPANNGAPIITKFIINKDNVEVVADGEGDEEDREEEHGVDTLAEDPAAQWCPQDMSQEHYTAIRECARQVAAGVENGKDLPAMQPYSEALGTYAAYHDLVHLVERYKSRAEERLVDLQLLRRHSKLYVPVKPNGRKMKVLERIKNEAAAQICRYIPTLLFHKRRLYDCVMTVISRSGLGALDAEDKRSMPSDSLVVMDDIPAPAPSLRSYPQSSSSSVVNTTNYPQSSDMIHNNNNFNQGFFGKHDFQQLTNNEENAIKMCAERLQEELYQYPIMAANDSQIAEELAGLETALNGSAGDVERAHEYMREMCAVSGRLLPSQRGRPIVLSQYDLAVNEAAYHIVKNNIGLLTNQKVLTDLARKVIRVSGCNFRQNVLGDKKDYNAANPWLYNQDNVPELDLSSAMRELSDSLEDGPSQALFLPSIEETRVDGDEPEKMSDSSEDDEEQVYRPREFRDQEVLANVHLECEAGRNIVNECAIFTHTGTDNLRKVRILDFHSCSFTSIMPIDINLCYNLVELNLADNALSYLPRCLFLPNLAKLNLRHNRFLTVPLIEQFPKLQSVELDDKVARKLNKESLTYFCADLRQINNTKFDGSVSEQFTAIFNDGNIHIESMVQSRWDEDLAMYFKKGVTKSELQKVIETLVLSVRERRIVNEQKFFTFKDLIARRAAEHFLESKIIEDDENEEEYKEKMNEDGDSDDEEERSEMSCYPKSKSQRKNEFDNQAVEKDQILLRDEPLDRLTNVVGQALRNGKTVVYSVMRTAARQPGGDLIPVGGGGDNTSSNNYQPTTSHKKSITEDYTSTINNIEEGINIEPQNETIKIRPGPASFKKRKYGIEETDDELDVQRLINGVMEKMENYHSIVKRRVGRPKAGIMGVTPLKVRPVFKENSENNNKNDMFKVPKSFQQDDEMTFENRFNDPIKKDKNLSAEMMRQIDDIIDSCLAPVTTVRLRQLLGLTTRGRPALYISQASNRSYIKHDQEIPESALVKTKSSTTDVLLDSFYDFEHLNNTPLANKRQKVANEEDEENGYTVDIEEEMAVSDYGTDNYVSRVINDTLNEPKKNKAEKVAKMAKTPARPAGVVVSMPLSTIFNTARQSQNTEQHKMPDYDPLHFIRCHAMDNNPKDSSTKVWRCVFEPNPMNPYMETTAIVATCGGECVCLIDCRTGKVVKRFKSRGEEFYTVAWTTVELAGGLVINILAAAGKSKDIRLLHRDQLVCYGEMTGHDYEVACMTFHPRYPTVLFSGDTLANILVWDIGVPSSVDYTTKYQLLSRLVCPRAHLNPVLNLVVMPSHDVLVAGCEDGVFVWQFPEFRRCDNGDVRSPDFEVKVPTHQEPCFDGLARLSENTLLVKCVEEGEIFTVNLPQIIQHFKAKKFDDQQRIVADVIGWLRWQITDEIYINVSGQMNRSAVLCGDNEGTIWLYDMVKEVREENGGKKFKSKPAKILDWPECSVENGGAGASASASKNPVVNCVEMSSDGNYLVAVTDNNLVCVWSLPANTS